MVITAKQNYPLQRILSSIQEFALKKVTLRETLEYSLELFLSLPAFSTTKQGVIFLSEDDGRTLSREAQLGLDDSTEAAIGGLSQAACSCDSASAPREIIFFGQKDCKGGGCRDVLAAHAHYSVPIFLGDRVIGLISCFVTQEHVRKKNEEDILDMFANTLAVVIIQKRGEIKHNESEAKCRVVHSNYEPIP